MSEHDMTYEQAMTEGRRRIAESFDRGDYHDHNSCWFGNGRGTPAIRTNEGFRIIECSNNYDGKLCRRGLGKVYPKYDVKRLGDKKGRHDLCRYFVLDPRHDRHALAAMFAYAISVRTEDPELADELFDWVKREGYAKRRPPKMYDGPWINRLSDGAFMSTDGRELAFVYSGRNWKYYGDSPTRMENRIGRDDKMELTPVDSWGAELICVYKDTIDFDLPEGD